ncbi:MAG: hypothetical protein FK734_09875, partial [Asgard group archaeon]|nr:hypothetical protein [Asgard group archaeon]
MLGSEPQAEELSDDELGQQEEIIRRKSVHIRNSLIALPILVLVIPGSLIVLLWYKYFFWLYRNITIIIFVDSIIVVLFVLIYLSIKFYNIRKTEAYKNGERLYTENKRILRINRIILSFLSLLPYIISIPMIWFFQVDIIDIIGKALYFTIPHLWFTVIAVLIFGIVLLWKYKVYLDDNRRIDRFQLFREYFLTSIPLLSVGILGSAHVYLYFTNYSSTNSSVFFVIPIILLVIFGFIVNYIRFVRKFYIDKKTTISAFIASFIPLVLGTILVTITLYNYELSLNLSIIRSFLFGFMGLLPSILLFGGMIMTNAPSEKTKAIAFVEMILSTVIAPSVFGFIFSSENFWEWYNDIYSSSGIDLFFLMFFIFLPVIITSFYFIVTKYLFNKIPKWSSEKTVLESNQIDSSEDNTSIIIYTSKWQKFRAKYLVYQKYPIS